MDIWQQTDHVRIVLAQARLEREMMKPHRGVDAAGVDASRVLLSEGAVAPLPEPTAEASRGGQ
jgi:hypothetical protein